MARETEMGLSPNTRRILGSREVDREYVTTPLLRHPAYKPKMEAVVHGDLLPSPVSPVAPRRDILDSDLVLTDDEVNEKRLIAAANITALMKATAALRGISLKRHVQAVCVGLEKSDGYFYQMRANGSFRLNRATVLYLARYYKVDPMSFFESRG